MSCSLICCYTPDRSVWLRVQYRFPDHYQFVSTSLGVNYERAFTGKYDGVFSVSSYLYFFTLLNLFKRDCLYSQSWVPVSAVSLLGVYRLYRAFQIFCYTKTAILVIIRGFQDNEFSVYSQTHLAITLFSIARLLGCPLVICRTSDQHIQY